MRRGVMILAILLVFTSFVSAFHPICDPLDEGIHGVFIDGDCYDCGDSDGICPDDYGAVCDSDPDCIYEEDAFWSADGANPAEVDPLEASQSVIDFAPEDTVIYMVLEDIGIGDGNRVNFTIREYDTLGTDDIINDNINSTVVGGDVVASWIVSADEWEAAQVDTFWFEARAEGWSLDSNGLDYDPNGIVRLNLSIEEEEVISSCSDYLDQTNCTDDNESVGIGLFQREDPAGSSCYFNSNGYCEWQTSVCVQMQSSETPDPGNTESCDEDLARDVACGYPNEEKVGDCTAGDQFFTIRYSSLTAGCDPWETQPIPCPAKLRLPFFGVYSIIASLSIISLIYVLLSFRKEDL